MDRHVPLHLLCDPPARHAAGLSVEPIERLARADALAFVRQALIGIGALAVAAIALFLVRVL